MKIIALIFLAMLTACVRSDDIPGQDALFSQVENGRIGTGADQWIEFKNLANRWERTGLIFGYVDDYEECAKAIAGLKKANYLSEYRCVPAN